MIALDAKIRTEAVEALRWDNRVDHRAVTVETKNGAVTLSGEVPTYLERSAAVEAVWSVQGVAQVINRITVRQSAPRGSALRDSDLEQRIRSLLAWNSQVDETAIDISVQNGEVDLDGSVDAYWKRQHVESQIAAVEGVVRIQNRLGVVPTKDVADEKIARDVIAALERDRMVDAARIEVTVQKGIVSLSGGVPTWIEWRAAENAAALTPGVIDVRNSILVEPGLTP